MVRLMCSRSGWGTVQDPETGDRISVRGDEEIDRDQAERIADEYPEVSIVESDDDDGDDEGDDDGYEERTANAEILVQEPWQTVVSRVESGDSDAYLDELEQVEQERDSPRQSVLDAIDERRARE